MEGHRAGDMRPEAEVGVTRGRDERQGMQVACGRQRRRGRRLPREPREGCGSVDAQGSACEARSGSSRTITTRVLSGPLSARWLWQQWEARPCSLCVLCAKAANLDAHAFFVPAQKHPLPPKPLPLSPESLLRCPPLRGVCFQGDAPGRCRPCSSSQQR